VFPLLYELPNVKIIVRAAFAGTLTSKKPSAVKVVLDKVTFEAFALFVILTV
jgi:hypothetical protein